MRLPVIVASMNGHFVARPAYATEPQVTGSTKVEAIKALGNVLRTAIAEGNLAFIDLSDYGDSTLLGKQPYALDTIDVNDPPSIMDFAGAFRGDTELEEICREAYRQRDELRKQEWGE